MFLFAPGQVCPGLITDFCHKPLSKPPVETVTQAEDYIQTGFRAGRAV